MACKRLKNVVRVITLAAMTAVAAPAFAAGDILDTVGQPGSANPAAVEPAPTTTSTAPAAQPRVVKRTHAHHKASVRAAGHKAGKRHRTIAKSKSSKVRKSRAKRHAASKHRARRARAG